LCTPTPFVKKIAFGTNISCITGNPFSLTGTGDFSFLAIAFFRVERGVGITGGVLGCGVAGAIDAGT
jgi:hypothetical protein